MKIYVHYLYTGLLLSVFLSLGCRGCDDVGENQNDLGFNPDAKIKGNDVGYDSTSFKDPNLSFEVCNERCLAKKIAPIAATCEVDCEGKLSLAGRPTEICSQRCEQVVVQANMFVGLECKALCSDDDDRDGVPNSVDNCPRSKDGKVNWLGCVDEDSDGIADKDDDCPGSVTGEKVNVKGCKFAAKCEEGNCSTFLPKCASKEECDRRLERPLARQIPLDVRKKWILRELSKKASPINCPTDKSGPGQPTLSVPPHGINHVEIGTVRLAFQNNQIIESPKHALDFYWQPVEDACKPITYALLIESYHCHHIQGVEEPDSYYNNGWCKWEPVTYASNIEENMFTYEFDIGKHLFDIHKAFEAELNFSPPRDGPFTVSYQPFWLRTRVLSIDGNGSPSASGMHSDHRYFVFYDPGRTRSEQLVNIPVAP